MEITGDCHENSFRETVGGSLIEGGLREAQQAWEYLNKGTSWVLLGEGTRNVASGGSEVERT